MDVTTESIEQQEYLQRARNNSLSKFIDDQDLIEDIERVVLVKKLITRLKAGRPNYRLILNHLVVLFNTFESSFVIFLLKSSVNEKDWYILNTFLIYMRRSLDVVNIDTQMLEFLKKDV